jgi:hypothetical protein
MFRPVTVAIIGSAVIVQKGRTDVEGKKLYIQYLGHGYRQLF